MNGWLPDTSVLLELRKPAPDRGVISWADAQARESLFLSTTTIAAIRHYAEHRCDASLSTEVGIWLDRTLKPWFAERILPVTEEVILEWFRIQHGRSPGGAALKQSDLLLAATARVHGLTVCTRDDRACRFARVPAFSPWTGTWPLPDPDPSRMPAHE